MKKLTVYAAVVLMLPVVGISQGYNDWDGGVAVFAGGKRERAVSFAIDDIGYVCTGEDTASVVFNDLWAYDPILNTWTQKMSLPGSARRNAVATAISGKGYVGLGINASQSQFGVELNDWWQYDPVGNSWVQKANYPLFIYFATAFTVDTKGYVCCGKLGGSWYTNDLYEYNPSTDNWTQKTDFPNLTRYALTSFVIEDKAYVGTGTGEDWLYNDLWEYKPSTNSWVQRANMPTSPRNSCVGFAVHGKGYICTGGDGGYKDELWEYDPLTDVWTQRDNFTGDGRRSAVGFVLHDFAYVGTGKGVTGIRQNFRKYTPYPPASVSEVDDIHKVKTFPNPCVGKVNISSTLRIPYVEVHDLNGRLVWRNEEPFVSRSLNVANWKNGTYIFTYRDERAEVIKTTQVVKAD